MENKHPILRALVTLGILLVIVTPIAIIPWGTNGLSPEALAEGTQKTIAKVKEGSTKVYSEIQDNIDLISNLRVKLERARAESKPFPLLEAIKDLEVVTRSFENLSSQRSKIREDLLSRASKVEGMSKRISAEITLLNTRKEDYSNKLLEANRDPNLEIARTRQKAISQTITYISKQIELWQEFRIIEKNIRDEILSIQAKLDTFLSVIESSAELFREGLNLLKLQENIDNALSLLSVDIPEITRLTSEMESSWDNLDYLIESLTSLSNITN